MSQNKATDWKHWRRDRWICFRERSEKSVPSPSVLPRLLVSSNTHHLEPHVSPERVISLSSNHTTASGSLLHLCGLGANINFCVFPLRVSISLSVTVTWLSSTLPLSTVSDLNREPQTEADGLYKSLRSGFHLWMKKQTWVCGTPRTCRLKVEKMSWAGFEPIDFS